ncbi:Putative DNA-binding domain-containing protein [Fibrobacter sp. UWCM]|uniref:AlbA family DNA-binding domain-containing protein n=1 Tax=Fibrobacter sp. UWCM TaxID=1896208 RepID=UPI0009225E0B|nr:ATP-binding protein [Fibrobacter sp. UWCM]SHH84675.1 Putative DNA-binding domain-containing protein [Fibrobacter sp. UWCM]
MTMLYKPFKTAQDFESLIHLSETPEGVHWDYKQAFNPKDSADAAIDLAAFANTYGGTLLIGVAEKKINGLKVASGFAPNVDAEEIKKLVHTRINEIISPKIDVQVVPIVVSGNLIVAVNVEPSINLVGVCLDRDRRQYSFPYRTEFGNQFMTFEEVEKRMVDNKTRAMYLKLKKYIPSGGKVNVYPAPIANNKIEWRFEWIHNSENEIRLDQNGYRSIDIPISFIEEVWNGRGGICLKLNERLYCGSPNFIDFEDSEDVAIFKQTLKIYAEMHRNLRSDR